MRKIQMNERINQLANEAGLQPFEDCGPKYVYKMEKFAELIVRECAEVAYKRSVHSGPGDILKHFGVEE